MGDSDSTADSGDETLSADSTNEKEIRNKPKVLSDPSPGTSSDASNLSLVDFSKYEVLDKMFQETLAQFGLLVERLGDTTEEEARESQYAEILADSLRDNLLSIYKHAVNKMVGFGFDMETAQWAIFNTGLCHGSDNDVLTDVIMGALDFLTNREKRLNASRYYVGDPLKLISYTIQVMIKMLRDVRPNLTVTDAMWCLLVSDLNLSYACMVDVDGVSSSVSSGQKFPGERSTLTQSKVKSTGNRSSDSKKPEYPRKVKPHGESSQPKTRDSWPVHQLSKYESSASSVPEPNACPDGEVCGSSPSKMYVPEEEKEKAILTLQAMKLALEKGLQYWSDWANKKVMQATRTLQMNQAELKMLRQEKAERLDECTKTKISEMKKEILDATRKTDVSNARARQLELEKSVLAKEMEAAKSRAQESATKLQAAIAREKETSKKSHLLADKGELQEQLKDLKNQIAQLDNQIGKAKERRNQFEVLLKHEKKEKERAEQQTDTLRKKREAYASVTQTKIDDMKKMSETNMRKYEEDIQNLKKAISQLKLTMIKSNTAAHNLTNLPETTKRSAAFQDNIGGKSLKRERECVMCMEEEISVVFVPCRHQILCRKCNEVHEKGGQKDCPTCRAVIEKRVHVRYRDDQSSSPQE